MYVAALRNGKAATDTRQYTARFNVFDKPEETYCPTSVSAATDDKAEGLLLKWAEAECARL